MKVKDVFQQDPTKWRLVNEGVSSNNVTDLETLKYELRTFVCDGEYHQGLTRILRGYLDNLGKVQKAAWVSGFYGSGKSHLVKVLRYLWTDYALGNGETARSVATLPDDVRDLLKELSTEAKRGAGLHSAGGTLKAGTGTVRVRLLGLILKSAGLPEKVSIAKLVLDLRDDGKLEAIQKAIRDLGKNPDIELERPYSSASFQKAYLASYPHLGSVQQVSQAMLASYPATVAEVSIDDMLALVRRALNKAGKLPCTIVILDEVQQFISGDNGIALEVQEVVEACSNQLDGRVMFVGTGQSALTDTAALQRLMGRFTIKVHLRDNDVDKVVRTVVLRKKEDKKKAIDDLISRNSGEIARQLKATKLATQTDDDRVYIADYPLLPVRRRFWEHVLHSVDPSGTAAQMRTQLRVAHEACRSIAEEELGAVIPADFLYDQLASDLIISGEMQKRFQEIIEEQRTKKDGQLRGRICGLVFLINKLPRNGADTGVRANSEHLADLLTDDLGPSATRLREKIPSVIDHLRADGVLMDVDGEYRLQTTEGAAWEAEYRRRRSALLGNEVQIAAVRGQELSKALQKTLAAISYAHGNAKVARKLIVHHGSDKPTTADELTVWVRDGFQESESAILQDIQRRSVEDATIHVLVPKAKTEELKQALAGASAAEETLNYMGNPTARDGQEARTSTMSRLTTESQRVHSLIAEVVSGARVFLSGGQELSGPDLRSTVQSAAGQVLQRLYPKFDMADSPNWGTVWKKAKEGSASALGVIGYSGDPDKAPVSAEIIRFIGAGKKGSDVIDHYTTAPFGWPKDAVDATLAILMVSGHLSAKVQGRPVTLGELDQRKVGQADFRLQHPVLSPTQKLKIKKLFTDAGHQYSAGDEATAASTFVNLLHDLARKAGGPPPAPEAPHSPEVTALDGLLGNDLLFALYEQADSLRSKIEQWKKSASRVQERLPNFAIAERLIAHGEGLELRATYAATLDAIRNNRSLLDDPDPVAPVLKEIGGDLRAAITVAHSEYRQALSAERARLEAHPVWIALPQMKRDALLKTADVRDRPLPETGNDTELAQSLDFMSLAGWRTQTDALAARFNQVLAAAIKESEPKARAVTLPPATIRNEKELDDWLTRVRKSVAAALADGPVIL